jgi:regulator of sigma E protease
VLEELKAKDRPAEQAQPEPVKPVRVMQRGAVELQGSLTSIDTGTELTLNALPLGGFVRPRGENDPDVPDGLAAANPWKRLGVLFAGPLMNLITAVIVLTIVIAQSGISVPGTIKIAEVTGGSPAALAGLQNDDIIKSINGTKVSDVDATRVLIRANLDKPITLLIQRNGQQLTISATPLSSRSADQGALGVALGYPTRPAGLGESIVGGFTLTGLQAISIMYLPVGLIQGAIAPDQARLVGLKGIYDFFGQAIQRDTQTRAPAPQPGSQPTTGSTPAPASPPTNYVLELIAMLSISLGVFNLFPIPALDGGRILFTLPEILFRRRIPIRFENAVNSVAFVLLLGLMLVVNLMDFVNPSNVKLP